MGSQIFFGLPWMLHRVVMNNDSLCSVSFRPWISHFELGRVYWALNKISSVRNIDLPKSSTRALIQLRCSGGFAIESFDWWPWQCCRCVFQEEDDKRNVGVSLSKDLMAIAGEALKANITTLGPLVLPLSEQLLFFGTLVCRKLFRMQVKPYIPDFKLAFEHFCIHAGGRAVLDELEKNLDLSAEHLEPSRMTLYRWETCNTLS